MKKVKYLFMLCVFAILATGCVKYNASMTINKDKSMEFTIIYAIDKSMFGDSGGLKEEDMDSAKQEGFTVEKYSEGSYEGFKLTKKVKNIDDVSIDRDVEYSLSKMLGQNIDGKEYIFKVQKGEDKNTYFAKFNFDSDDSGLNPSSDGTLEEDESSLGDEADDGNDFNLTGSKNMDLSQLANSLDLSFNVTLPNGAVSSNATKTEDNGKKLVWKLATSGTQSVEFSFELDNNAKSDSNILLWVGIGAGVLLLIAVIVVVITKSKKKELPVAPVANETKEITEENK